MPGDPDREGADRAVEAGEVDPGGSDGCELRVRREAADPDEEAEEERDGKRQDDDVREREREDDAGLGEGLFALDEKLRELDETADDHEPRVGEEAHEGRRQHLDEHVPIDPPQHRSMVAGRGELLRSERGFSDA